MMRAEPEVAEVSFARHPALGAAALAVVSGTACGPASAQDTAPSAIAGRSIVNVATAELAIDGVPAQLSSNTSTLRIDELLDVKLTSAVQVAPVTESGQSAVPLTLTNVGNGNEAFVLDLRVAGDGAAPDGFAMDRDGDRHFDPTVDPTMESGAATRSLAPGEAVPMFALYRRTGGAPNGTLMVQAHSVTGFGEPGSDFLGQGDGGSDAVVGMTKATAPLAFPLAPAAAAPASGLVVSLVKSQAVLAADGTATPGVGATITYSIAATIDGSGTAPAVLVADAIPTGTRYVPGSLRLDGAPLSDAADADGGGFDGARIAVALGDIAAPATRNIRFQVTIQ